MDFHLVVETAMDGRWMVWDATRLAPRQTPDPHRHRPRRRRHGAGHDALRLADHAGADITAVAGGDLPLDDHQPLVELL